MNFFTEEYVELYEKQNRKITMINRDKEQATWKKRLTQNNLLKKLK